MFSYTFSYTFFRISFLSVFSYMFSRICFAYFFLLTLLPLKEKSAFSALLSFSTLFMAIVITIINSLSQTVLERHHNFFLPCFYRYNPIYRMKFPFWRAQRGSRNYNCVSSAFNEPILPTSASKTLLKYLFSLATFYATSYPVLT